MNKLTWTIISLIIVIFLLVGCDSSATATATTPAPAGPMPNATTKPTSTPTPTPNPSQQPGSTSTTPAVNPEDIRLEVIYFHRVQRCASCLCFEERINYVMKTYFAAEMANGKIGYQVLNIGDSKNKEMVDKYQTVGTQLFINTIVNGRNNIKDIQAIWNWKCRTDKDGFDSKIKFVIEEAIKGKLL